MNAPSPAKTVFRAGYLEYIGALAPDQRIGVHTSRYHHHHDFDKDTTREDSTRRENPYAVASEGETLGKQKKMPCLPPENEFKKNKYDQRWISVVS